MTTFSSPDNEITGTEDIIRVDDVKKRIRRLKSSDCHGVMEGDDGCDNVSECPSCYGEAEEELAHLKQLLRDLDNTGDDTYLVHDGYLTDYTADDSHLSEDDPLFIYVDWERVARDLYRSNCQLVVFRGNMYWVMVR